LKGHGFQPCRKKHEKDTALAPEADQ